MQVERPVSRLYRFQSVLLLAALATGTAAADETATTEKAGPVFKDGEAQIVPAFKDSKKWIRQNLWVETEFDSDGDGRKDRMHVDVTRPEQTQTENLKVPVVYETSPYYAGTGSNSPDVFWNPRHELNVSPARHQTPKPIPHQEGMQQISDSHVNDWVPRGFAVVHSCSPGTGRSQGCPTVGGFNESLAPKAVIDWLNGRANGYTTPDGNEKVEVTWCTGKVGMTGTSYNGTLPLAAATTGVAGLEAIIPVAPNTSYYHYYRSHGLVRHPGGYMGEDIDVLYDFIASGPTATRGYCDREYREMQMIRFQDRVTGDYNQFWEGRDYLNQLGPMKAAMLMAHAFNDWNVMPEHSVRIYEAVKAKGLPHQIYFHQGGHGGPPPLKQMNRWFTRYLYGVENGVEKDPKSWIVREGATRGNPESYPDYPHPEARPVTLQPQPGGVTAGPLTLADPAAPPAAQQLESLIDNFSFSGAILAKADWTNHRLLYATAQLKQSLHLSGTAKLKIRLSSSRPAANLSVWLVSLPWTDSRTITDDVITRGWADPQNHASLTESDSLTPGQFYDLTFTLQPDDQVIAAGEKIGLMIFSSDRDFTLWPDPGTILTVDLSQTSLELPVVGGTAAFQQALNAPLNAPADEPAK
jgi:X-Pro dipeptidyl-peptidase